MSAALILSVLFSMPAFAAYAGFTSIAEIRRPLATDSAALIALLLGMAAPLHICISLLLAACLDHILTATFSFDEIGARLWPIARSLDETDWTHVELLTGYLIFGCATGWLIGILACRATNWGLPIFGAYYGVLRRHLVGFPMLIPRVAVLSRISLEGGLVLYEGILVDLSLRTSGSVDHVVIGYPAKRDFRLRAQREPDALTYIATATSAGKQVGDPEQRAGSLMIEGEDLENLYFWAVDFNALVRRSKAWRRVGRRWERACRVAIGRRKGPWIFRLLLKPLVEMNFALASFRLKYRLSVRRVLLDTARRGAPATVVSILALATGLLLIEHSMRS